MDNYEETIYQNIVQYLCSLDIEKELDEEFLESGDENIYWNITDVSVEKEDKKIIYYVNLDISLIADLVYQEDGDYPYNAGKIALALIGHTEIIIEEYSIVSEMNTISIEKSDILHIEPEVWQIVKDMENKKSCKDIIDTSKNIKNIQKNIKKINNAINLNGLKQALQQYALLSEQLNETVQNSSMTEATKQFSVALKAIKSTNTTSSLNETMEKFTKQFSSTLKALKYIKPTQDKKETNSENDSN